jgi:hypothetical protein
MSQKPAFLPSEQDMLRNPLGGGMGSTGRWEAVSFWFLSGSELADERKANHEPARL